jgi:diaminopimelate epimerase
VLTRNMLRFTKMNGAGNDFIMIDNRTGDVRLSAEQIVRICDRHRGVGADGILLIEPAQNGADFRMRYYNSDGGEAEMCGNGARCFARFAKRVANAPDQMSFETPAGVIGARLEGDQVRLTMSEPRGLRFDLEVSAGGKEWRAHFINSGVPHVVVPVTKIADVDVKGNGASIRQHEMFAPAGANVNFIEKRGARAIAIRTYERGVENETLACGTGVVASALVFAAMEKVKGPISVLVKGGSELSVGFERDSDEFRKVTLTGPAEFVFEGTMEI